MIGLLDPALFLGRPDSEAQLEFDFVLGACKQNGISLPPFQEYWPELWTQYAAPLERTLGPTAKHALQEIRKIGQRSALPPQQHHVTTGVVWRKGFLQLFGAPFLPNPWEERMAAAAIRAIASGDDVVMFTRRVLGRNLVHHVIGQSTLDENTRWLLHLQPQGMGPTQLLCVYHPRNLIDRWTARFDWRLPRQQHGTHYPFCPPLQWWKGSTSAFGTVSGKVAWLDRHENGWARPNIPNGAGYHWDVFISSVALQQKVGLSQINVVAYGGPATEGTQGDIHHVPTAKAGHLTGRGWAC